MCVCIVYAGKNEVANRKICWQKKKIVLLKKTQEFAYIIIYYHRTKLQDFLVFVKFQVLIVGLTPNQNQNLAN